MCWAPNNCLIKEAHLPCLFSNRIRVIGLFATTFCLIHQKVIYSLRNYDYGECHDFCLLFQVWECIGSLYPPKSFRHPDVFFCFFSRKDKINGCLLSPTCHVISCRVLSETVLMLFPVLQQNSTVAVWTVPFCPILHCLPDLSSCACLCVSLIVV